MVEWIEWLPGIWKRYDVAEWFVWIFRICVVIGIWFVTINLKKILAVVRDIHTRMEKLDTNYDALPSVDSFLSSVRSVSRQKISEDSEEES